jgi:uncharacterized membrane protein YqjE
MKEPTVANPPAAPRPAPQPGEPQPAHTASGAVGPVPGTDEPSIGKLVSDASTHVSTLVRGEIELAKLELRSSVKNAGTGAVMFILAAAVALFSLVYGFQALAAGIAALGVPVWLSFLIVCVFQLLVAALLVFLGVRKVKRVKAPEKTIATTKDTVNYFKSRG